MNRTSNSTIIRARELRRAMSLLEGALWQVLRTRPGGLKFRRQHPMGPFVLDFYCPAAKLAIEVDGAAHDMGNNPERDARRDAWLKEQGLRTLRVKAADVLDDLEAVVQMIVVECGK